MNFEWDERKALINQDKHGVSFQEARTVFYDESGYYRAGRRGL